MPAPPACCLEVRSARGIRRSKSLFESKCGPGQVLYTPWCDDAGKVMDDGTLAGLEDDTFRLTAAEPNLRWLLDNAQGLDVEVTDVSDSLTALSLQGPNTGSRIDDSDRCHAVLKRSVSQVTEKTEPPTIEESVDR